MKSSYAFEKKEKNDVEFKMEIGAEKFEEAVKKAYQKTKHKYTADGFRKGKVPKKILEMKYGEGIFYDDAINILFPEEYTAAIDELGLDPVDRPSIDLEQIGKNENLILKVTVTVKPEITLGDYKGIEAKKVEYNVTDEDVDQEIQSMQERNSRLIQVDREVKDGDSVTIDYEGYVGDEQFEGGTAENQVLVIGSGSYVPGFEEQLIGHKAGDHVEVKVTFPEEYHENLAGKDAVFKVTIKEVQEK
ncbi:MAG: trigger factor, partial [Clostridia bacterium]|nr:trigger factor [Clostridia bacterium]